MNLNIINLNFFNFNFMLNYFELILFDSLFLYTFSNSVDYILLYQPTAFSRFKVIFNK